MANLEAFKNVIKNGVRPNQFDVAVIGGPVATQLSNLTYLCHASSLPGSVVGQAPAFHRGRQIPLAGERTFNPWTITVYCDPGLLVRTHFETWSNWLNNYADATGSTDPNFYKGAAIVRQLDRNDAPGAVKYYDVLGIFPIDISEVQVAWQQNDVIEEFNVTFAVERVAPSGIGGVSTSLFPA